MTTPSPVSAFAGLRIGLVGPLPPPAGGMANQTAQLAALLRAGGARVETVATNAAVPRLLAGVWGVRALARLLPLLWQLWRCAGRVDLFHVMANSGWSWHLHAAPAIWIGRLRGIGVLVNYRGGEAASFMAAQHWLVRPTLRRAHAVLVPSGFLAAVFARYELACQVLPNIIDLHRFQPAPPAAPSTRPQILVARHLEAIYDYASAIRAMVLVREQLPQARLVLCGTGHAEAALRQLARELLPAEAVHFAGLCDPATMAELYRQSAVLLNPSRADNMPNSVLEALASRLPVVSTNVGGIPYLLQHHSTALLVPAGDAPAMAAALLDVLGTPALAEQLAQRGVQLVQQFGWNCIAPLLAVHYRRVQRCQRRPLYTRLIARCLFPLQELFKRHDSALRRHQLERSQWYSPEQLDTLQSQRLRKLLMSAGKHVPYYRQLFAERDFQPGATCQRSDLARLPVLRKATINAQRDAFRSDRAGVLQRFNTGGSSGEPLIFYLGRERISHDVAAKWRATRWWGVDVGDKEAVLWGSPIELSRQDRIRLWRDRLMRTRLWPAFALSAPNLDAYLRQLREWRPAMLFGYPSALCRLAQHAMAKGLVLNDCGVKVVFVTAERLYDEQRRLLEATLGCPVANGYGGRDAGFIAHECPEGGMHISAEDIVVEILDRDGQPVADGDSGEIVVTHLANADFPLIRYATGDVGALSTQPCRCGRGLPLLQRIEGRVTDFVVAQDGTVLHGLALIYVLRDQAAIQAFRIVQESLALTRIQLVCRDSLAVGLRADIIAQFRARLGHAVEIAIEEVSEIAPEASGKHRYVISKVAPPP
ncbi:MAG: glycosyltransferase [Sphingomonadaceae bacterium]